MAWENPPTWDADDPWLHTDANQYVTDNTMYLYGQLSNAFVLNDYSNTQVVVNATTDETDLVSFVVEADELAGANGYEIVFPFEFQLGSAAPTLRLKFGGTTIATISDAFASNTYAGIVRAWLWETASNTQSGELMVVLGDAASAATHVMGDTGTGAVDTSSARTLSITCQHSTDNAGTFSRMKMYRIHKLTAP
jgi:hypothetical protein